MPHPRVPAPGDRFNFAQHLIERNTGRGAKAAYLDDAGALSYGELAERLRRVAAALLAVGVRREERVLLLMHDCSDWPVTFLGAMYAGVVPVAVNTLLSADDVAYMLVHSRAQVAFVSGPLLPTLQAAMAQAPHEVKHIVVSRSTAQLPPDATDFEAFVESRPELVAAAATAPDDPGFWLYSSGSTGRPKGTVHTHANPYWTAELYGTPVLGLTERDICFSAAKLFFAYGLGNALSFPLSVGATVVLMAERPTPDAVFKRWRGGTGPHPGLAPAGEGESAAFPGAGGGIAPYPVGSQKNTLTLSDGKRVAPSPSGGNSMTPSPSGGGLGWGLVAPKPTVFFGAPTGYAGMLAAPNLPARSEVALRLCSSAGEALPADLGQRFAAHFGCEVIDGIGSTEMLHIFLSNRPGKLRYGTTGWPVPGYAVELRGDDGRPVPDGETGDLFIQGPSAALLYWGNREKTRETFQGAWVKSGDKYSRNADASYTYAGRSDDMLKVSGIYVSPFEVEATLVQHPAVLEAAVIGVVDADGLTRAKAYVVLKAGQQAGEEELRAFVKERLAPYKTPRLIEFMAELPKTATGKIQRFKLRALQTNA